MSIACLKYVGRDFTEEFLTLSENAENCVYWMSVEASLCRLIYT